MSFLSCFWWNEERLLDPGAKSGWAHSSLWTSLSILLLPVIQTWCEHVEKQRLRFAAFTSWSLAVFKSLRFKSFGIFSCGCVCGVGKIEDTTFRVLGVFVCYIKSSWHFLTSCEEWNSFRAATFLEVGTQDDKPTLLKPSFSEKDYLSLSVSISRILRVDHAQIFKSSVSFF